MLKIGCGSAIFVCMPVRLLASFVIFVAVMNTGIVVVLLSLGVVCAVLGLLLLSLRRDNARLSDERAAADEARRLAEESRRVSEEKAAAAENVTIWMQSGYRSVKYQTGLYERKTKYYTDQGYDLATAKEKAAAVVNPPGYSEHNCGLAADLNSPEHTGLDEGFENTTAFRWLCEHAVDYGFILRYPKGAEDKTEITYEPWHWRYVGRENAAKISASGLCFEDYIAQLHAIAG